MSLITYQTTNVADTFMESDAPTTNFDSDTRLLIGELNIGVGVITRSLVKFPLDDGSIPSNSTINAGTLSLFKLTDFSDNSRTARIYRLRVPFIDSQATYNIRVTGTNWSGAGASSAFDRENTDVGTRAFTTGEGTGAWADFTLTPSAVQDMISGGTFTNNGFLVKMDTETNDGWSFASNTNATGTIHAKLVVDYTVPIGGTSGMTTNRGYW